MPKKLFALAILLSIISLLPAQNITVTGQYLDKKQNPIPDALVSYHNPNGLLLDSTLSLMDGSFELSFITGIVTHNNNPFINKPYPNPFNGLCNFTINISTKATIVITSMNGLMVDKHEIKTPGLYKCSWGGQNRIGQQVSKGAYNISVIINNKPITHKVLFNGDASQRMKSERVSSSNYKAGINNQAHITFLKENTSELDYYFDAVTADTNLNVIIGNPGPEVISQIIEVIHADSSNSWNLNNYFYNDEQSIYTSTDENFIISNDSIMTFVGTEIKNYTFNIIATDAINSQLTVQTQAQIKKAFACGGYYINKQQQAIAGATVSYWEAGNILSSQTTTLGNGYWSMLVATDETNQDKIDFNKTNTSELDIYFTTPAADTTFGNVIGNTGPEAMSNINETHYSIDAPLIWNLNNYFINDDQSIYTQANADFYIVHDTLLETQSNQGIYATTIIATDTQDTELTAQITADVNIEYTISIPDTAIIEDYQNDTLFTNLNQYINPNYQQSLTYTIVSQSNINLIDINIQDSLMLINSLQADSAGSSYVGVEITTDNNVDTVYFTLSVVAMPDVSGYITDIFDTLNIGIAGVVIEMTLDSTIFYYDTTDANGYYSIQLAAPAQTEYYFVIITKAGYTPFHTWATVETGSGSVTEDYTIIPSTYPMDLYNYGFRASTDLGGGFPYNMQWTTHHYLTPPPIHTFSDNSLVGGIDITLQYSNLVYNIQNILPTFNPRDVIPNNLVEHTNFGYTLQDNEMGAYFDDSIGGAGVVSRIYDGPKMNKCSTAYIHSIGGTTGPSQGADNKVFNQELGSCFGSVMEPAVSSNYNSVFTQPTSEDTYTQDDYDSSTIMLDRARVHYVNLSFDITDPEGWDWEMKPSEVLTWYPENSKKTKKKNEILDYKVIGLNGEIIEKGVYPIDQVPSRVMKMAKIIFSEEEIRAQERKEAQLGFKLNKWFKDNTRRAYTYSPKQEASSLSKREIRKMKREKRRNERTKKRNE